MNDMFVYSPKSHGSEQGLRCGSQLKPEQATELRRVIKLTPIVPTIFDFLNGLYIVKCILFALGKEAERRTHKTSANFGQNCEATWSCPFYGWTRRKFSINFLINHDKDASVLSK